MSTKITDVAKNSLEDGVEDFVNAFLFRRMRTITEPLLKQFESGSEFDDAMQSFIQTLSMGLTLYAYNKIMVFFFERGVKISVFLWTYIVAGTFKRKIIDKLKSKNLKGRKLSNMASMILGADRTSDRIQVAKMIQENVKSFDSHKFHYENQQQKIEGNINNVAIGSSNLKNSVENSYLTRFTHKTMTGTWENTLLDKRLYEKATGVTLAESGSGSWSSLYFELNKFNEFSKTVDGDITNLATLLQKALARQGLAS